MYDPLLDWSDDAANARRARRALDTEVAGHYYTSFCITLIIRGLFASVLTFYRTILPNCSKTIFSQPAGFCTSSFIVLYTGAPRSVCGARVRTFAWGRKARLIGVFPRSASAHARRNASAGAAAARPSVLGCVQAGFGGQPASVNFGQPARDCPGRGPGVRSGSFGGG